MNFGPNNVFLSFNVQQMSQIDLWTFVGPLWKSVHLLCYFLTMIYKKVRIEGGGVWWLKALLENIEVLFVYAIYVLYQLFCLISFLCIRRLECLIIQSM